MQHDEERVAVVLDLGALVAALGVLDGEGMQVELRLHQLERLGVALEEGHPDEAARHRKVAMDLVRPDFAEPLAVLVCDAVDQHRGGG